MLPTLIPTFVMLLTWLALGVNAADGTMDIVRDNQWHGAINIGGSATTGNRPGFNLSQNLDGTKANEENRSKLYAIYHAGKSELNATQTTTADLLRLGGRYDHRLNSEMFVFGGGEYGFNRLAAERLRRSISTGLGYTLYDTPRLSLDLMSGVSHSQVKYTDGALRQGQELFLAQELAYKLSASTVIKQKLSTQLGNTDLGHRVTFDARVSTALMSAWTLDVGLNATRVSVVPPGVKHADSMLSVGIGYKY